MLANGCKYAPCEARAWGIFAVELNPFGIAPFKNSNKLH